MSVLHRSAVSNSGTLWTIARQAPQSMGILQARKQVGCHVLLQGIFPTQALNPALLHCRWILYHLSPGERLIMRDYISNQNPPNTKSYGYWMISQFSSVTQSCPTLCDPINCSTPGLPVHHQLPEFTQTHVHRVGDAIQPSHPLSSPSPPTPNPS